MGGSRWHGVCSARASEQKHLLVATMGGCWCAQLRRPTTQSGLQLLYMSPCVCCMQYCWEAVHRSLCGLVIVPHTECQLI
jgi:hypothetical protein